MSANATAGIVVGLLMTAALGTPAGAGEPVRLDEAQLDRVSAGLMLAQAGALAAASGDQLAQAHTDTLTRVVAGRFVEVGVSIARAHAVACCDPPTVQVGTSAVTDGELAVAHTVGIVHSSWRFSRGLSVSTAIGINLLAPRAFR